MTIATLTQVDKNGSTAQFKKLIWALTEAGLTTEVRNGDDNSLLVFIKAADESIFTDVVYRSRMKDWLYGIRQIQPVKDAPEALTSNPLTPAERHRQILSMIVAPKEEGGAGITPKHGDWKNVASIFPLQDRAKNKKWLAEFSTKTILTPEDLDEVRDAVGEKVSYSHLYHESR